MASYQFNFTSIASIISAVVILLLGLHIFLQGWKKKESLSFFIAAVTAFLWLFGMGMVLSSKDSALAVLWYNRFSFLGVGFISTSVYFLTVTLTNQLQKHKWGVVSAFLISAIFYLLANTNFPFGVKLTRWGYFTLYSSSLIGLPYILYFSLVMVYSFYLLWKCFKSSLNPIKRKQLKLFALALLVAVTGSNDFLLTFGYQVYPFGYLSILFFTFITLYAMRYYGFLVLKPAMAYQTIFQSIHNFVVGIDLQGEIGFINNSAQDILGYKEKEIFGKSIETIFPEEDKFIQLKDKIRQGEPSVRGEESYLLTKHKEKIPVLFNFSPILEKGMGKEIFGFVLSAQDITLLKEKEEELVKSEEKYRTTFENTGTAMAILEEDTTISLVNAQFEKLSGYSKEEIEGKMKWTKLVHPDDLERMQEYNKKRQGNPNNAPTQYEFKGIDKKGNIINILINANLIPGSKKTIISLIDLTEKIKLQEQLKEYSQKLEKKVEERTKELLAINKELKKANQVKNDFLANVSHELRTPLTSIRSFSEILLNYKEEDKATQEEFLEIINKESERLTRLINDILDISKIESGKIEWNDEFLSVDEIISIAINSVLPLAEKQSIPIKKEIVPFLPFVFADKDRLVQVFSNLLSNALKFTDNGEIRIGARIVGDNLLCYVSDTGMGIPVKDQRKLFRRFEQIEGNKLLGKPKGTGLGLAICKEIIEHYQGKIWVESEAGRGATFYFTLPSILMKKKTSLEEEEAISSLEKKVILVADDEPSIRRYLYFELSKAGYKVIDASNGQETIQQVKEKKPDLLILDILMPILDGYDVLRELKTNPELSRLPVIILSILEDKEKGLKLGANAYLNKPLEKEQLLAKINEVLENEQKKILLVDDDKSFVKATRFFLRKNGYEVYVAFNGEDGLKVCRERKPDLVILDIFMPEKDGMETLKALKKDPLIQKTPVIMLTVNAIENGRTKCLSLGAEQYLTKKEGLDFLLEKIREILKDKNQKL